MPLTFWGPRSDASGSAGQTLGWKLQVAGVVEAECMPVSTHLLEDIHAARVLLDPPDLVEVQAKEGAGCDLVHNLVTGQGDDPLRMAVREFLEKVQDASLDIGQAFAAGKHYLARGCTPE